MLSLSYSSSSPLVLDGRLSLVSASSIFLNSKDYPSNILPNFSSDQEIMDSWLLSPSPFLLSLYFFLLVTFVEIPISLCDDDSHLSSCSNLFNCGEINIGFPFWGENRPSGCGHPGLMLNCEESATTIEIMNVTYRVLDVNPKTQILKISREDYLTGICSPELVNTTLDPTLFDYGTPGYQDITIAYGCASLLPLPGQFSCPISGDVQVEVGAHGPDEKCNVSVVVPILLRNPFTDMLVLSELERVIREGFDVEWKVDTAACRNCTTDCGYNLELNRPTCYFSPSKPGTYVFMRILTTPYLQSGNHQSATLFSAIFLV
jgi:hypothetical protein